MLVEIKYKTIRRQRFIIIITQSRDLIIVLQFIGSTSNTDYWVELMVFFLSYIWAIHIHDKKNVPKRIT